MKCKKRKKILITYALAVLFLLGTVVVIPAAAIELDTGKPSLPIGFSDSVIGNPGEHADCAYDLERKAFVLEGTGLGIGDEENAQDSYHYVSYELPGDASMHARLLEYEITNAKEGQFGIVFRSDLSSLTAQYLAIYFEPAYHKFYVSWRESEGGVVMKKSSDAVEELSKIYYFYLEKNGSTLFYEISTDSEFKDKILSGKVVFERMPTKWNAGFAVSNKGNYQAALAVFDQVVIEAYSQVYFDSSLEQRPIDTVKNVKAESQNKAVKLTWDLTEGATAYEVYRSEESDEDFVSKGKTGPEEAVFVDLDVENYKRYFYRVIALNEEGVSYPSEIVSAFPDPSEVQKILHGTEEAEFVITSEMKQTVLEPDMMFKGYFLVNGLLNVSLNGEPIIIDMEKEAKDPILLSLTFQPGRNVLNLTLENEEGYLTKKQYQFVYLDDQSYDYVVDAAYTQEAGAIKGGKKIFSTIQEAINDVSEMEDLEYRTVIFVKKGVYNEQLTISRPLVSIIGEGRDNTIVTFERTKEDEERNAVLRLGSGATGFSAENIAFENRSQTKPDEINGWHSAVINEADQTMFFQCRFAGQAGALLAGFSQNQAARQYYQGCIIEGYTALVTGNAQAVLENCEIVSQGMESSVVSVAAVPFTRKKDRYGFLFYDCMFLKEKKVREGSVYLGAVPTGVNKEEISPFAVFSNCYLENHIRKEGYQLEDGIALRYYEFAGYGPGVAVNENRKQLLYDEASKYTMEAVFEKNSAILSSGKQAYAGDWNLEDNAYPNSIDALYVSRVIPLVSIKADREQISLKKGDSTHIKVKFTPFNASNQNVVFQSLNEAVAKVDEDGKVTGRQAGYAVIQMVVGNCKSYVMVQVTEDVPSVLSIPVVFAVNREIKEGSNFSPLDLVRAYDRIEGEITDHISVTKNTVDTSRQGTYEVWYVVRNQQGRIAGRKIQVIVE